MASSAQCVVSIAISRRQQYVKVRNSQYEEAIATFMVDKTMDNAEA